MLVIITQVKTGQQETQGQQVVQALKGRPGKQVLTGRMELRVRMAELETPEILDRMAKMVKMVKILQGIQVQQVPKVLKERLVKMELLEEQEMLVSDIYTD